MTLDFENPEDMFKGLEQLERLEWHEKWRHGVIHDFERFDDASQRLILKAVRYYMGDSKNIWLDGDSGGIEFIYASKKRGNKPWDWCGDTILFKEELAHVKAREIKARQFKPGDEVSFEDKNGDVLVGYVHSINKRSISVVVPGSGNWTVSPNLLEKVE